MRKKRLPKFRRQEWSKYKKLGEKWRKPRGRDSKLRVGSRSKLASVSIGYRSPRETRGIHPSGFTEVLIHRPQDLEGIDSNKHAARIAASVGRRKREKIMVKAKELGIRVLNPGVEKREAEPKEETSS